MMSVSGESIIVIVTIIHSIAGQANRSDQRGANSQQRVNDFTKPSPLHSTNVPQVMTND